jgi:Legionella pneumophila major outer membrane protein precursor
VKRLSQCVLCVAVFGSPIALAADPASDAGGDGPRLGTAPASISNLGANPIFITNATIATLNNGCSQPPPAGTGVTASTPAAPSTLAPAVTGVAASIPAAPSKPAPAVTGVAASTPAAPSTLAPAVTGVTASTPAAPGKLAPAVTAVAASPAAPSEPAPAVTAWAATPAAPASAPVLGCTLDTLCPGWCACRSAACGVIGGAGLYLLEPYISNNQAYGVENTVGRGEDMIPPGVRADQIVDLRQHIDVAPLVWLGYLTEEGWGGRVRYWYLREGTTQTTAPVAAADANILVESAAPLGIDLPSGSSINVTSELAMQFLDVEGLDHRRAGSWDLLVSGGLRFMRVDETYNAYNDAATLLSNRSFQGIGPTVALEARRPFGISGLDLYGSARGSVVIGSANQEASEGGATSQAHQDRGVPIAELELGLEYDYAVGHARLFAQIGLVGQDWFGVGNASRSAIHMLPGGDFGTPATGGYSLDSDIALLGVCFRIGVDY